MTSKKSLKRVEMKQILLCFGFFFILFGFFFYTMVGLTLMIDSLGNAESSIKPRAHLVIFVFFIGLFCAFICLYMKGLLYIYLSGRDKNYSLWKVDRTRTANLINFILYQYGLEQISQKDKALTFTVKNASSWFKKPVIASLSIHQYNNINLTPTQSLLLISALSPQSGAWGLIWKDSFSMSLNMTPMSGHEIMDFNKHIKNF